MRPMAWGPAIRLTRPATMSRRWIGVVQVVAIPMAYAAVAQPSGSQLSVMVLLAMALLLLFCLWRYNLQLKRQGAMMTQLLDHTPTPLLVLDPKGRIQGWNRAATRLFGWEPDSVMNEPVAKLLCAQPQQRHLTRMLSRLAREGHSLETEQLNCTREGQPLHCQWHLQVMAGTVSDEVLILATVNDITEQKAVEQNWVRLASTDPLTGLANRRHFQSHCRDAVLRSQESGAPLTLLYLDLDDFKLVNDRFGHEAGDAVLAEVAKRLQGSLRLHDLLARIGGDEFVIVLEETDFERAEQLAGRIKQAFARAITLPGGERVHQGISIGLASSPADGSDADALINAADRQMYHAKQGKLLALSQANEVSA
ncbi:diguanylate cyclase [Halomonas denitrificans]|nr:diguanylate cyclase [Halomonas denitrificans]